MKKSICIISLSYIARDARVLREIQYLSYSNDVTVIGFGDPHPAWNHNPNIRWKAVPNTRIPLQIAFLLLLLGKFWPSAYEKWYWQKQTHVEAYKQAINQKFDAYHANDWNTLPLAVKAAKINQSKVIFDAHEYTPGQYDHVDFFRRKLLPDAIIYLLDKNLPFIDASMAASPAFVELYNEKFNINPLLVLNMPDKITLPPAKDYSKIEEIHLVHHGIAKKDRCLEIMIEAVSLSDKRFRLNFMLLENDPGYIQYLKQLSARIAPDRVIFHDPVSPEQVVAEISQYDIGFYILPPTNLNNKILVPNKLFDFINAGLAVCIGPSPSMVDIVKRYGFGCVASTFEPRDVANMLNNLDVQDLSRMTDEARKASLELNAENEMVKVVHLYENLLN
ncbi:MAG: hypothetical protein JXB49_00025 [Bacteroidales bacterium]|nr:hypothetical protein [Bacteroidales bacterium]